MKLGYLMLSHTLQFEHITVQICFGLSDITSETVECVKNNNIKHVFTHIFDYTTGTKTKPQIICIQGIHKNMIDDDAIDAIVCFVHGCSDSRSLSRLLC